MYQLTQKKYQIPEFLEDSFRICRVGKINSSNILVGIECNGVINYRDVRKTVHYSCLQRDFTKVECDNYTEYMRQQGRNNDVVNFKALLESIKNNGLNEEKLVCVYWSWTHKKWLVLDGFHRLAIWTYLNSESHIKVIILRRRWIKRLISRLFKF